METRRRNLTARLAVTGASMTRLAVPVAPGMGLPLLSAMLHLDGVLAGGEAAGVETAEV